MKSNYVLMRDTSRHDFHFYVLKRIEVKSYYKRLEQFQGFFETKKAAYAEAIRQTSDKVKWLNRYIKDYKRKGRMK